MKRRTDPFKVLILIALAIVAALQVASLTSHSTTHQLLFQLDSSSLDIHEHVSELNVQDAEYTNQQVINEFTKNLPYHSCDTGEYQVTLENEGALIYDGDRFVGFIPFDAKTAFFKLMLKDNQ
jgi:hypothetical protein